ncbi:MAG: SAM-dependent methyltransferase [Clostridiaceae bacterium]|nr:class I SAM-dependent methyltransferase [Oscillospiraceae bacterium]NLO63110.1 SAM-dependent methyltransferase [Clostridiaceae bacterium]
MYISDRFGDYELLFAGGGEKFERWGDVFLQRPDPQAVWPKADDDTPDHRPKPHAIYHRSDSGGGYWATLEPFPHKWRISYPAVGGDLTFIIEPTGFKHTGLFPEQAVNWDFCGDRIRRRATEGGKTRILNLFAYTGGATMAAAVAGAEEVVHVDASKGMIARAKENMMASGLEQSFIRYIAEDCTRFVEREIRRKRQYDGIIMDPPAYGRGPSGELWKLEDALFGLVGKCCHLLSDQPLFFVLNSYASSLTSLTMENILGLTLRRRLGGFVQSGELGIPASRMNIVLPCGSTARWTPDPCRPEDIPVRGTEN